MKKLIIAVAAVAFLASCKKDYTCECTTTGLGLTSTVSADLGKQSKSDAEDACSAKVGTPVTGFTTTCVAKEK
jgi:hypothetical protein